MPPAELFQSRRSDAHAEYYYRRSLGVRELLPALGIAIGAGLFAFYVARLMLQRTPLRVHRGPRLASRHGAVTRGGRARADHPAA